MLPPGGRGPHGSSRSGVATLWNHVGPGHSTFPGWALNTAAINRGDGSDGSDSIGIGQWNGQRAEQLKAFAAAQGKPVTDLGVQLGFVQHELETSESAAAQRLKGATNPRDAAAAFALGYERPQGFQTGDPEKVLGWQNRLDQTNRLAASGGSTSPIGSTDMPGITSLGQPFTDAEAQANPWLRTEYRAQLQIDDKTQVAFAKSQIETLSNAIKFTGNPSPEMIPQAAAALQIADRFPDQLGEQATKLRGALAGAPAGFAAAGSPDRGADILAQSNELARTGNPFGLAVAENVKSSLEAGQKLLKNDQFEYWRQAEVLQRKPMPLDFSDPAKLGQSVAEHATAATVISGRPGASPVSIFTPAETAQVKGVMQRAPVDTRLSVLSAIADARMPEPVLKATLGSLGQDPTMMPLAWAGSLARYNYGAARDIVAGQAMMQSEPKLAPKSQELASELASAISPNDLPFSGKGSLTGPREGLTGAVQALYAKYSSDAGDLTGVFNQDRFAKALEDASGGIRSYRGSRFVAPWYGASQEDTDAAIRSLTDKDFVGAQTSDGKPFSAADLKPSFSNLYGASFTNPWRLQSAGDGKYLVFSGSDQARQYLGAVTNADADRAMVAAGFIPGRSSTADAALTSFVKRIPSPAGKFVLDLGAKRDEVEQAGLHLAMPSSIMHLDPMGDSIMFPAYGTAPAMGMR